MEPTPAEPTPVGARPAAGEPRQLGLPGVLGVWAAAALPLAALAWLVAPALDDSFSGTGDVPLVKSLLVCLTGGLVWQFVLVVILVWREQRSLRWPTVSAALWLRSPTSPRTGRTGGRVWLVVIPLILVFALEELIPTVPHPDGRDFGVFLSSDAGQDFLNGAWGWFALIVVLGVFNTVLGEELLFRGYLLPRMNAVFGRGDWVANGLLFAAYHLHVPWAMPATLIDTFVIAYPTKRYRSAWIGIIVHSSQTVFVSLAVLTLVA